MSQSKEPLTSRFAQVFGGRDDGYPPAEAAAEQRQAAKSRVGRAGAPQTLWGFRRGLRLRCSALSD
jgi:hypothetical protein